ncbi:hypothetical protein RN629_04695 [Sphingomonadaceae bacterium jetA1]|jgi:hypothetical protein|uniref:hypothetical protein n=1 Tax=Facivitalis istanbulensis TaxID=3075838 RepID=UPI00348065B5
MLVSLLIASVLSVAVPADSAVPGPARPAQDVAMVEGKPIRYCVKYTPTGSRISRKLCRTAEEWVQREGELPDFLADMR